MRILFLAFFLIVSTGGVAAPSEVEMEACQYTLEVKKELKLTPSQEPKVEKVYSDLTPALKQIQEAMKQREQMRKSSASPEAIEEQTRKVVALENQCRERGHELPKPILSDEQLKLVCEMEEVHRRKIRERQAAGQPPHAPPQ